MFKITSVNYNSSCSRSDGNIFHFFIKLLSRVLGVPAFLNMTLLAQWFCEQVKGGIGRWKLTKVEERIFGGDCRGVCMHN